MEAIINSKKLKEQVGALQGILARKATIPVLSTIKIDANERGDLIMTATDLDVSLIVEQETDILRPGSICLNGRKLGDITATFPNEPVHLKLDDKGEKVEFRAGRFKNKLSGTQSEQFPEVARVKGEAIKIPAGIFYEGLRRTIPAVTEDNKRFTINGILLLIEDSTLKMVSTDGHRLCYFRMTTTAGKGNNLRCLIPIKAARELKSLLFDELRINQTLEDPFFRSFYDDGEWGEEFQTERGTVDEFIEFLELSVLTEREIVSCSEDYLVVEAETECDSAGISDCSYYTERLGELVGVACEHFKPSGFRYDYNDGCYDRYSGYSMSSESVSVSLRESSNAPVRERMLGMVRLREKLAAMEVSCETIEKLTAF